MPYSDFHGKLWSQPLYKQANPSIVYDFGCGAGVWYDFLSPVNKRSATKWIGVDIWPPYVEHFSLHDKYDEIVIDDIRTVIQTLDPIPNSLGIAGDVLEHLPWEDAVIFVEKMKTVFDHILISTPIIVFEQGAWAGNEHEAHLWHPTHEVMLDLIKPKHETAGSIVGAYWWDK